MLPVPSAAPPSSRLADWLFVETGLRPGGGTRRAARRTTTACRTRRCPTRTCSISCPSPCCSRRRGPTRRPRGRRRVASSSSRSAAPPATSRALQGPRGPIPAYSDLLLHDMGPDLADGMTSSGSPADRSFAPSRCGASRRKRPTSTTAAPTPSTRPSACTAARPTAARDAYVALRCGRAGRGDRVPRFPRRLGAAKRRAAPSRRADSPRRHASAGPTRPLSASEAAAVSVAGERCSTATFRSPRVSARISTAIRAAPAIPCRSSAGLGPPTWTSSVRDISTTESSPRRRTARSHPAIRRAAPRPPIDPISNTFETRQTPPLFGLGFLESIPDADILANADCDNPDPSAISGCAHILPIRPARPLRLEGQHPQPGGVRPRRTLQ